VAYGFTTNKVAERAGVNIASLYQYYPNHESLLFHLHEIEWEETWAKLQAVLDEPKLSVRERLHKLTLVFFFTEAEESELRLALKSAEVLYQNSKEYREMRTRAFRRVLEFMRVALKDKDEAELAFKTEFIMTLITSFAEAATSSKVDETKLRKQALLLSEMINGYFQI
jgi:AcrR family transcriptional regulator